MAFASLSVKEKLSPNIMELQRMVANSMALLARQKKLSEALASGEPGSSNAEEDLTLDAIIENFRDSVCNRSIDMRFKCNILISLSMLCKHDPGIAD